MSKNNTKVILKPITLNEYQDRAHLTSILTTPRYYPIIGLCGETGEVAELLKKSIRDGNGFLDEDKLKIELGDVLWYLAEICTRYKLNLEDVAIANLNKLADRKQRNVIHGEGDNR